MHDFHTHTFLSDGELSPVELIRRAHVRGYRVIGVADHAGPGNLADVVRQLVEACAFCQKHWDIRALPGVELTHLPPVAIAEAAVEARRLGAEIIVVHGESPVEPVPPGTNWAAVQAAEVDVLGHPGFVTPDEAEMARVRGVFVELSARRGHSLTNGHVAKVCIEAGAHLIVDSDAHHPDDLLTRSLAVRVARGSGLSPEQVDSVLGSNPIALLERLARRRSGSAISS